jgi:predicted Ser/Thr protein kinase
MRKCARCGALLGTAVAGPVCLECQRKTAGVASGLRPDPGGRKTAGEASSRATPGASLFSPPPLEEIAEYFPQLEIYELVGIGGMGMVYKARQPNLDRLVALKILSPDLSSQPAFAERFSREAKALARLHHSNIVSVYDFGRAGPYYYFLMEYVDGVDLHTLIQQKELKPPEAVRIVVEICRALEFAHDEGIIHRDLKPGNILIDKKGRVKMADFGLAKLAGADGRRLPAITLATGMMGTPQYMAPEQIEKPSEVDQRADLYSVGVILYEMLTGELPLGKFPLPSEKARTDARLDQVVMRALEKEPARRYQRASEILTQVEAFSAPATAAVRSRKMAAVYLIGMVCALAGVAVLGYALYQRVYHPGAGNAAVRVPPPGPPRPARAGAADYFTNTPDGPSLGRRALTLLQLTAEQAQVANAIIHANSREFARIQSNYVAHSRDAAGHVRLTEKPMTEQDVMMVHTLRDQMWNELSGVFTPEQLDRARKLPSDPLDTHLFPINTNETTSRELWKDSGGMYHYMENLESARGGGTNLDSVSPNISIIPSRYRRYLEEEQP